MAEGDLLSMVLTLAPVAEGQPAPRLGRAAFAIALARMAAVDPVLVQEIHAGDGPKPLTCSGLLGARDRGVVLTDMTYKLRYTALSAPVVQVLGGAFQPGDVLALDGVAFNVTRVDIGVQANDNIPEDEGDASLWTGHDAYDALAAAYLRPSSSPQSTRWRMLLASPTAFKTRGRSEPLPLPGLFFGSLAARWNAFSPIALPEDGVRRYAEEMVVMSRFNLTSMPGWGDKPRQRIGSVGSVTYTARNRDRYWLAVFSLLAAFARYSGVGVMTTMGMGQVREETRTTGIVPAQTKTK